MYCFLYRPLFALLFLATPLFATERVRYYAGKEESFEGNFTVEVCQTIQEHQVCSSLAGGLKATLLLEKEGVMEGEPIVGLPDRVQVTIEEWEGVCSSGEEKITYSSKEKKRQGHKIASSYERAAAVLVGVPLTYSLQIDEMAGAIRLEDQGEFAALVSRNPLVQEICPMATMEDLLQQVFAPAYVAEEQWQRLANSVALPVFHSWEEKEGELFATTLGEVSRARILLSRPLEGSLKGNGSWKKENGLHFRTEQQVEYTAHLEGGEEQELRVKASWLLQGNG